MNLLAIMSAIDTTRIPRDALPRGMDHTEAQHRILTAVAGAFALPPVGTSSAPIAAPYQASGAAMEAIKHQLEKPEPARRGEAQDSPTVAGGMAGRTIDPQTAQVTLPAGTAGDIIDTIQDETDNEAEADDLIELIGEAGSLAALDQVHAEIKTRLDSLNRLEPLLASQVWAAMNEAKARLREAEPAAPQIEDVGLERIQAALNNFENIRTKPDDVWEKLTAGITREQARAKFGGNPTTAAIFASAQVHHPAEHAKLVAALDGVLARFKS